MNLELWLNTETQMEKQREAEERLRQKEMERLQSVIQKEQEAMARQVG